MVTVKINGVEYNLKGEENEEYLQKVARYVDKKIKDIIGNNTKLSTTSAAVLTAVNAVDDLMKCDRAYSEIAERAAKLEKNEKLFMEQLGKLQNHISLLESDNKELQLKLDSNNCGDILRAKEEDICRLSNELTIMQQTSQEQINRNNSLKAENKELKFQLQSSKYKLIDLQNKLIENQIDLVKVKKNVNPLIRTDK